MENTENFDDGITHVAPEGEFKAETVKDEEQTYEFKDCEVCGPERRFISTVSPKGFWICCQCGHRVAGRNIHAKIKEVLNKI